MFKTFLLVVAVLFSSQLTAAKVYKWVDEDGQIHYAAQKPVGQEAETVKLQKAPKVSSSTEDSAATEDQPSDEAADGDNTDMEAEAAAKAKLAETDRINNKKQCDLARKNYAALTASVRVSRTNDQGETVRMSDDERVNALQAAQQGIKKYCK